MELQTVSVIEMFDGQFRELHVFSLDEQGIQEAIECFKKCIQENDVGVNFKLDVDNMDFSHGDQKVKLDDYCVLLRYK